MSLRVWLPLIENTNNQGISPLNTFSYNTLTQQTDGKLGKCYSGQGIYHLENDFLSNEWSLCAWVKSASWSQYNDIILCKNTSASDNCQFYFSIINGATLNFAVNAGSSGLTFSYTFATNTWYHVAATYNGSEYALYINGEQKKKQTISTTAKTGMNNLGINCRSTNAAGTSQTGDGGKKLNDIRIYDHCLSAAEVKEIAQGLVLHYKLDGNNLFNVNTLTHGNYLFSNGSRGTDSGWALTDYIQVTPLTSYIGYNLVNGGNGNPSICFYNKTKTYMRGLTITANTPLTVTTESTEYYVRISIRKTNNDINKMSFFEIPQIIQDSSGYNHNLTVTGDLLCDNITPRYSCSTYFNGSSYGWTNKFMSWFQFDTCTISAWIKPTISVSSWTGSIGVAADHNTTSKGFGITDYANKFQVTYTNGSSYARVDSGQSLPVNEWHHIAATLEATTVKMYFDGTLVKTATIDWGTATINANTGFQIGVGVPGTDEKFTGNYSDVRFYCTPLLDTDIKQLYNVGMKVDKQGQLHPFEFEETSPTVIDAKFRNNNATSVSYDNKTDTYTIVSPVGTSGWGYGVRLDNTPELWIPYGATYRWTAEVWTPVALSINSDYNNTTSSSDANWGGNDNDNTSTRLSASQSIPANTWTRIYRGAANTASGNTNQLPIRDFSSLGLVTDGQSEPVTWKIRHLQWYIVDNNFKPQLKKTGVFKSSHFTETETDLNKPAQFSKKMFSVNANQFIER